MAQLPAVTVEMALTSDPLADTPVWTDITASYTSRLGLTVRPLRSGRIKRGRSHELDRMQAGTCSLTFRNDDDRLNPWNTMSPFYGNLLTANQSDVETNTTGFSAFSNCTLARTNAQANHGTHSLEVTTTTVGSNSIVKTSTGTGAVPVQPGATLTALVSLRTSLGVFRTCFAFITWYDSSGSAISDAAGANISAQQSVWTEASAVKVAPANAAFASLGFAITGAGTGEVNYADTMALMGGPTSLTWHVGGREGNLKPTCKIRVKAVWNATTYYLFTGYVESIEHSWPSSKYSETTINAADGFKVLALAKAAKTTFTDFLKSKSASGIWWLADAGTGTGLVVTAVDSSGNGNDAVYKGRPEYQQRSPLPTEVSSGSVGLTRGTAGSADLGAWVEAPSAAAPSGTGDWSVVLLVEPRSVKETGSPVDRLWHVEGVGSQSAIISIGTDGKLNFTAQASGNGGILPTTTAIDLGRWNRVVVVKSGTTGPSNWAVYVNGADDSDHGAETLQGTGNVSMTANAMLLGGFESAGVGQGALDGLLSGVAVVPSALSSGDVASLEAASYGLAESALSGTHIGGMLDASGIPSADRDIDAGQYVMQPIAEHLYETSSLPLILDYVDSEGYPAAFWFRTNGNAVFEDFGHAIPSSIVTFGDYNTSPINALNQRNGSGGDPPILDDQDTWTTVVCQRIGGVAQVATDAAAVARFLPRAMPSRTNLRNDNDDDVASLAAFYLARFKAPADRVKSLTIHPIGDPTHLYPYALSLDVQDRIGYIRSNLPGKGDAVFLDLRIEGVEQQFSPGDWKTTYMTVPL